MKTEQIRLWTSTGFFLLFIFAPVFDLFRFDLNLNQFVVFGQTLGLGLDEAISAADRALNILLRFVVPLVLTIAVGVYVAWRWGRFYCGWFCPHFVVVDLINTLMRRASGRPGLWERDPLPLQQKEGSQFSINRLWWIVVVMAVLLFSLLWTVVMLTYLLPPAEIYGNLVHGTLTRNQFIFIVVGTLLWAVEFAFARHLFCKFGCAIGMTQSLIWMGNRKGIVLAFDQSRASLCSDCDASCELVCPMRLKPRGMKRHKFSCTQCMLCIEACERVQSKHGEPALLKMLEGECAYPTSSRGLGQKLNRPVISYSTCYSTENRGKTSCSCSEAERSE